MIETTWLFSDSRSGGHEPTVSESTLLDVVGRDALAEKRFVGEDIGDTLPHGLCSVVRCFSSFAHVGPEQRVIVGVEVRVSELLVAGSDGFVVDK